MKARILFATTVLVVLSSWTINYENHIEKAEWLIGTWENKTSRGSIYETWSKVNDTEFSGKSYALKERDTILFESIRLVQEEGTLFYIPTVKKQNAGLPVRFALKVTTDTTLVFENPQHDFPQMISYTKIDKTHLIAEISGVKNGQARKQVFPMQKIK